MGGTQGGVPPSRDGGTPWPSQDRQGTQGGVPPWQGSGTPQQDQDMGVPEVQYPPAGMGYPLAKPRSGQGVPEVGYPPPVQDEGGVPEVGYPLQKGWGPPSTGQQMEYSVCALRSRRRTVLF